MKLVLPYPVSANRYWNSFNDPRTGRAITIVSTEAKRYRRQVKIMAYDQGLREPYPHRVFVRLELYPGRPQDADKRIRGNPLYWDDDVRCVNLDNAWKVLMDALNGVVFVDDKWLWKQEGERMEPDGEARIELAVEPIVRVSPQRCLIDAGPRKELRPMNIRAGERGLVIEADEEKEPF
jgi:crossover junction endodeoxyribonuclease RusA